MQQTRVTRARRPASPAPGGVTRAARPASPGRLRPGEAGRGTLPASGQTALRSDLKWGQKGCPGRGPGGSRGGPRGGPGGGAGGVPGAPCKTQFPPTRFRVPKRPPRAPRKNLGHPRGAQKDPRGRCARLFWARGENMAGITRTPQKRNVLRGTFGADLDRFVSVLGRSGGACGSLFGVIFAPPSKKGDPHHTP